MQNKKFSLREKDKAIKMGKELWKQYGGFSNN